MEVSISGKPVLKNEFAVSTSNIIKLFKKHDVYVFGYGSLLYPEGWEGRNMREVHRDLVPTNLNNFERGPFGLYGFANFYGVIRTKGRYLNGVVTHIKHPSDYFYLMLSEFVVGLHRYANYRVVDVTNEIEIDLSKRAVVHTVANRPINRIKMLTSVPSSGYYNSVMYNIKGFHTEKFVDEFFKTGGFKNGREVRRYLKRRGNVNITGRH
ncbi:MAG: hypothetical protein E3J47_08270 [Candidatus Stahlbacteria bacterium]|nr:MAG: hypothetical protein E3J47_08270 [Candidatus Stahlbacteria bacterium]